MWLLFCMPCCRCRAFMLVSCLSEPHLPYCKHLGVLPTQGLQVLLIIRYLPAWMSWLSVTGQTGAESLKSNLLALPVQALHFTLVLAGRGLPVCAKDHARLFHCQS